MSPHDWMRLISLGFKAVELANRSAKVPKIRREITAPDGRKAVFVVPANEPQSVSIARMYPRGVIPAVYAPQVVEGVIVQPNGLGFVTNVEPSRPKQKTVAQKWFLVGCVGFLGIVFLLSNQSGQPNRASGEAPGTANLSSYDQTARDLANRARMPLPALPRVQLKTGANVRNGPSRNAAILRVAQQGEVFTRFAEANGWLHLGRVQPEGWVAQSVVSPMP